MSINKKRHFLYFSQSPFSTQYLLIRNNSNKNNYSKFERRYIIFMNDKNFYSQYAKNLKKIKYWKLNFILRREYIEYSI